MTNWADDFKPSSLVVQQIEIYYDIRLIPGTQQPRNDIDTYFRSLIKDLKVLWYNDGVQVWDKHKRITFSSKPFFVTVSDYPMGHNLSRQSKKVGCGCPHCFRKIDSQYLSESRETVYMVNRRYIPMKHQF
jgi:hypothetical protein